MASPVFNVAGAELIRIPFPIAGEQWVQLRFAHGGDDSPLLVQMPERAWHAVGGCLMTPTENWPAGECSVCGNMNGPP